MAQRTPKMDMIGLAEVFKEGPGCIECGGTGYRGRSAIHELLELDDEIREMLLEKRPGSEIRKKARDKGMAFLRTRRWTRAGRDYDVARDQ